MKERNRTKFTILGMLAIGPASGYEIIKRIKASTHYFWSESEGQIYPALAQCAEDGLALCKEEQSKKSARARKIYTITTKGKKTLTAWLKNEPQTALIRNELLLKLFFGGNIDVKDNIHHLTHHQKSLEKELETYEKLRKQLISHYKNSPHLKYWLITLDFGIKSAKMELTWSKESIKVLESE